MPNQYFDANATTPLRPEAVEAWNEVNASHWANPSAGYRLGATARRKLEGCRQQLADILKIDPQRILFTSGATEANQLVLEAFCRDSDGSPTALSAIEHPSLTKCLAAIRGPNRQPLLTVDASGCVPTAQLNALIRNHSPILISVMAAHNETGVIQPWQQWAEQCREHGIAFHCDASQWLGKLPAQALGACDFLTGCAHKFGGPKGTGFLVTHPGFAPVHGFRGGGQESGMRAGTEDVAAIAAMTAALQAAESELLEPECLQQRYAMRQSFIDAAKQALPDLRVIPGTTTETLWNTVLLIMPRHSSQRWIPVLDSLGFQVSAGSACATASVTASQTLQVMGLSAEDGQRSLRISSGWWTTNQDWMALASALRQAATTLDKNPPDNRLVDITQL